MPIHPYPDDAMDSDEQPSTGPNVARNVQVENSLQQASEAEHGDSSASSPDPVRTERIRQYEEDCRRLNAVYEKVQAVASELGIA